MNDAYKLNYGVPKPICELNEYENVKINDFPLYSSIHQLLEANPNIASDNVVIHLVNGVSGFGSQLTLIMQHLYYFKEFYPNVICLPNFSKNNSHFKYHDTDYNNSFFLYYKKRTGGINLLGCKQYAVQLNVIENYPFFTRTADIRRGQSSNYINLFFANYEFIKSRNVEKIMDKIKQQNKPLFGIHIRSLFQKRVHESEYLTMSIETRLNNVKESIDKIHKDYSIFVMSDVQPYIELASSIFNNVYYFENVIRVCHDYYDIIPCLSYDESGYKLGMDILNECFAMSMCDKIFVSNSNIPVIISTMNPNIEFVEY